MSSLHRKSTDSLIIIITVFLGASLANHLAIHTVAAAEFLQFINISVYALPFLSNFTVIGRL